MNDFEERDLKIFLQLPGEELILAKRQHWFILVRSLIGIFGTFALLTLIVIGVFIYLVPSVYLMSASILALILYCCSMSIKLSIDWYYHIYVITSRKILEIIPVPFYSDVFNDVFLDQVRATEVDIQVTNPLGELLDLGNVVLAFDRPSHDASFVLKNISAPYKVGVYLGDRLESVMNPSSVWFQRGSTPDHIKYTEDIFHPVKEASP